MKSEMKEICLSFYNALKIPIFLFNESEELVFQLPESEFEFQNILTLFSDYLEETSVVIHTDRDSLYWGKVHIASYNIVLGPVSATSFQENTQRSIMAHHFIAQSFYDDVSLILTYIPRLTLPRFLSVIKVFYRFLTNLNLEDKDIVMNHNLREDATLNVDEIKNSIVTTTQKKMDEGIDLYKTSYRYEKKLIENIEKGNISELQNSFTGAEMDRFGVLADTVIRNVKNMFIAVITIASRCAIRNGVAVEVAFTLSDQYIREIESTSNFNNLSNFVRQAVIDYSERIQLLKIPKGISEIVYQAIRYIEKSVNQPITVGDVAFEVNRSVSYFSTQFKNETGQNISSYITMIKMDEAKRLLTNTDSRLVFISNFLCYANQSHFQNTFKKYTGMTPLQYRKYSEKSSA